MRVVVAEDSVLLREGMAHLLEEAGYEVVGQAGNADELILKVRSYRPDVAVVDIRMPPTQTDEGLRAAKQIRKELPQTGVLVLSAYLESEYALELLSESADRLPAQGPRLRCRAVLVGRSPGGGGRLGSRSRDRLAPGW